MTDSANSDCFEWIDSSPQGYAGLQLSTFVGIHGVVFEVVAMRLKTAFSVPDCTDEYVGLLFEPAATRDWQEKYNIIEDDKLAVRWATRNPEPAMPVACKHVQALFDESFPSEIPLLQRLRIEGFDYCLTARPSQVRKTDLLLPITLTPQLSECWDSRNTSRSAVIYWLPLAGLMARVLATPIVGGSCWDDIEGETYRPDPTTVTYLPWLGEVELKLELASNDVAQEERRVPARDIPGDFLELSIDIDPKVHKNTASNCLLRACQAVQSRELARSRQGFARYLTNDMTEMNALFHALFHTRARNGLAFSLGCGRVADSVEHRESKFAVEMSMGFVKFASILPVAAMLSAYIDGSYLLSSDERRDFETIDLSWTDNLPYPLY